MEGLLDADPALLGLGVVLEAVDCDLAGQSAEVAAADGGREGVDPVSVVLVAWPRAEHSVDVAVGWDGAGEVPRVHVRVAVYHEGSKVGAGRRNVWISWWGCVSPALGPEQLLVWVWDWWIVCRVRNLGWLREDWQIVEVDGEYARVWLGAGLLKSCSSA